MKTRIVTGAMLFIGLAFAVLMGGWVFSVICTAAIGLALYEMIHALKARGHQIVQWPIWACTVVSIPSFVLYKNTAFLPLLIVACLIVMVYVLFHGEPHLDDILMSLMPLFSVTLPGMCLLAQGTAPERWQQVLLLSLSFLVPTLGDMAAYFIGSRYGKRRLIPAVSPNKTVIGAVAGQAGSLIVAFALYGLALLCAPADAALPPVWHFAVIGLLCGVVGQIGDLYASLVKRHCGIKDYGSIFPGHGGMMDRLDSVLFVSVLIYLYQRMMWQ